MNAVWEASYTINQKIESFGILKRLAAGEKSAVEDCVNAYGDAVWRLVKNSAATIEDAETITLDVFGDIWKYAAEFETGDLKETDLISLIIHRRLKIYYEQNLMCDS